MSIYSIYHDFFIFYLKRHEPIREIRSQCHRQPRYIVRTCRCDAQLGDVARFIMALMPKWLSVHNFCNYLQKRNTSIIVDALVNIANRENVEQCASIPDEMMPEYQFFINIKWIKLVLGLWFRVWLGAYPTFYDRLYQTNSYSINIEMGLHTPASWWSQYRMNGPNTGWMVPNTG